VFLFPFDITGYQLDGKSLLRNVMSIGLIFFRKVKPTQSLDNSGFAFPPLIKEFPASSVLKNKRVDMA
jgi:hypothetical protein